MKVRRPVWIGGHEYEIYVSCVWRGWGGACECFKKLLKDIDRESGLGDHDYGINMKMTMMI